MRIISRPAHKAIKHIFRKDNLVLIVTRLNRGISSEYFFIANKIVDIHLLDSAADSLQIFPLYLYETDNDYSFDKTQRKPNIDEETVNKIGGELGFTFTNEKEETENTFAPIDILDYIYAVLHSPAYRDKHKEFLKIDFPRVPYPKDQNTFWQLVKLGGELRQIHLLESPIVEHYITTYPKDGTNEVDKVKYEDHKVWINNEQYFDKVPQIAWEFYIGGYQPAQKWLKDRKGRTLSFEDIMHYQKIIVALAETDRIMKEIDKIDFL
jgi:predicted helicase